MLDNKKIFITGGTGSWGQELVKEILERYNPKEIIIYSRGEHLQVDMSRKFNDNRLKFIIGDVKDFEHMKRSSKGVEYFFHLAALKHVPICETNPDDTVKVNLEGTLNCVNSTIDNEIPNFIFISTDKAVDPINTYGVSKSFAEKIVINSSIKSDKTRFMCLRAGNVLGSKGSVVPLFKNQILRDNEITITHNDMTRYLMRLKDPISLIFKTIELAKGGEIFVVKMPSIRIIDLAEVMIEEFGNQNTKIKNIGLRPGEKLDEVLISRYEGERTVNYEEYYIVLPTTNFNNGSFEKWSKLEYINKEFNSKENNFLSKSEIKELLKEENWLSY